MKKNFVRAITLFLLAVTLLSFTACGSDYNVGVMENGLAEEYLSKNASKYEGLALFPNSTITTALDGLENGMLDFAFLSRSMADAAVEGRKLKIVDIPLTGEFYSFAVGNTSGRLLTNINKALDAKSAEIAAVFAAPSNEKVALGVSNSAAEGLFKVAVALDTAKYVTVEADGSLSGAEIDVARLVAEQMGLTLVLQTAPTANEAFGLLGEKTVDAVIGGLVDDGGYAGRANLSTPYYKGDYQVIVCPTACALFDDIKETDELLMVLRTLKKQSDIEAAWNTFYRSFFVQGGYISCLWGLLYTVIIAVCGLLIGIVIGTLIATVKVMPKYKRIWRILEKVVDVYVGFFRGTPIIVQLLIGYFVLLPALGISIERLWVAVIVYGMNSGAYVSEIMRGGIQSVDAGQLEAARALGLNYPISMLKIVIPQAVKNILPTLGNEFITLIKDTSVVSFIAIVDVTKAFRQIGDATYEYVIPYLMLALVYLVLVGLIATGVKFMERGLKKNER